MHVVRVHVDSAGRCHLLLKQSYTSGSQGGHKQRASILRAVDNGIVLEVDAHREACACPAHHGLQLLALPQLHAGETQLLQDTELIPNIFTRGRGGGV